MMRGTYGTCSDTLLVCLIERQIERVRWEVKQSFISRPLAAVTARPGC